MPLPPWAENIVAPFRRLKRWQQLSIIAVAVVVFSSLIYLSVGKKENFSVLFSNLSAKDAGEIVKVLRERGVPFKLSKGGSTILVPSDKVHTLRLELAAEGLPKGGGVGFEIFDKTQIGMTEFLEHVNYVRALQGELERTIRELKPIDMVRVHLVIPKKSVFLEEREEPKATVVVKLKPGAELSIDQVKAIMHLVASAVEGLKPDNVTVIDTRGIDLTELVRRGEDREALGKVAIDRLEYKRKLESIYEKKILDMLARTLGPNKAVAKVTVEVDFSKVEKYKELYDPENVVRSEELLSEKARGKVPKVGGIPGVESNLGPADIIASKTGRVEYEKNRTIRNYEISKTTEKVIIPPGVIKKISASVMVDGRYEKVGKKEVYKPLTKQELESIKRVVAAAIGYNRRRGDQVEVINIRFRDDMFKKAQEEIEAMEKRAFILELIKYTAFFVFLLLFIFLVLRPLIKLLIEGRKEEVLPSDKTVLKAEAQLQGGAVEGEAGVAAPGAEPGSRVSVTVAEEEEEEPSISTEDLIKELIGEDTMEQLEAEKLRTKAMLDQVKNWVNKNPGAAAKLIEAWIEGEF